MDKVKYIQMHLSRLTPLFIVLLFSFSISACAQEQTEDIITSQNRIEAAMVLLNNSGSIIPIKDLETRRIVSVNGHPSFDSTLNNYALVSPIKLHQLKELDDKNKSNTLVIRADSNFFSDQQFIDQIKHIAKDNQVIITGFGPMGGLAKLNDFEVPIIWSEDTSNYAEKTSAELIFGGVAAKGHLKDSISSNFKLGDGFLTQQSRLHYAMPERVGINGKKLTKEIDAIAKEMINRKAAPGAVVMIVKDNKVIFNKAYGNHYYDINEPTKTDDIFDLASVSKVAATTLAVMHLEEEGKIDLEKTVGDYLKDAQGTNKENIILRDLMLHQAGLIPFIPFYRDLTESDYRPDSSAAFPVKVSEHYYLRKDYFKDVMWPLMLNSKVNPPGNYVYSDISMYIMQRIIETVTKEPLDNYVENNFYKRLGMYSTGYNPWKKFPRDRIVPTELDKTFRKSQLIGYVHDQGAAMAGGVAGHAGLFSTANDLAIFGQLLLNKGQYGGEDYFKSETVIKYTRKYGENSRRGLGFDGWDPEIDNGYPSEFASPFTFGHTGYTGTCIWIDPEQQLIYIFLSNRVQPSVSPFLSELNIRSRIQDAVYKAIQEK